MRGELQNTIRELQYLEGVTDFFGFAILPRTEPYGSPLDSRLLGLESDVLVGGLT